MRISNMPSMFFYQPACHRIGGIGKVDRFVVGACKLHTVVVPFDKYVHCLGIHYELISISMFLLSALHDIL